MALIMGIVNVTPDSFLPGSRCLSRDAAARVMELFRAGADIVDIGAVSTRPGAARVSEEEEWRRLEPVLDTLEDGDRISIDTVRSSIVRKVFERLGRFTVNDISAGEADPDMLRTAGELGLGYIAMHSRGTPETMDSLCDYPHGVTAEVLDYFDRFSLKAEKAGLKEWILDPGFGFAKTEEQNLELLENLREFKRFGKPVLVGIADKRFTRGRTEEYHRKALENGADILRVHDVNVFTGR